MGDFCHSDNSTYTHRHGTTPNTVKMGRRSKCFRSMVFIRFSYFAVSALPFVRLRKPAQTNVQPIEFNMVPIMNCATLIHFFEHLVLFTRRPENQRHQIKYSSHDSLSSISFTHSVTLLTDTKPILSSCHSVHDMCALSIVNARV